MPFTLILLFIALPWLNPFAPGPTPATVPLLFSWACAAMLLGVWHGGRDRLRARCWMPAITWAWLAAGSISSVIGLCQYFGVVADFSPWMSQTGVGEAFANLRQRNQFATLVSMSLTALLWLAATGHFSERRQWLMLAVASLLAMGNAASSSRTGLLQLGLLCALIGVWGGWRQPVIRRVLLVAVGTYLLAMLALPWLAGLALSTHGMLARLHAGDLLCTSRLTLWSNVLQLIAQRPWLGWGWSELDYAHYITLYEGPRFCEILDNAHNLPLHLAVELGVPAALLLCGGFAWWVLRQRPWSETSSSRQLAWSVLALIGLHSLLEYPLWYGPFQMAVGLCMGMLWTIPARGHVMTGSPGNLKSKMPLVLCFLRLLAILIMAIVAYAAFDYYRVSQVYRTPDERASTYREDTLNKIRGTRFFGDQLRFAELTLTPLTPANAAQIHALSTGLLHFSPEPRVIEKVLESAALLGLDDEVSLHRARYRAAFPQEYTRWRDAHGAKSAPVK